ncbi:MAG: thiamine pyrophosphate-dependent enzyme, partial [Candidatus Delongbacteria bacterium]|nr:thiamine pyrophosphate-dependent enzyme [Candidatus Delongbacteria bacterium]
GKIVKVDVPAEWKKIESSGFKANRGGSRPDFIANVCDVMNAQNGDDLPVSAFLGREDGTFPAGTTEFEKRGVAVNVPEWISANCIQCNQCAYVCPHAVIRPFLINADEEKKLPEGTETLKAIGKEFDGLKFRIQVSVLDCTGCGNCADVCPAPKGKALVMKSLGTQEAEKERWDIISKNVTYKDHLTDKFANVKSSQFARPLFEFSGACAGCGETPYIKAITQLYGDRMMVANATGCSSIYGGSAPSTPYCANAEGKGPAWANSLFEDNAEYGFGMALAVSKLRDRIALKMNSAVEGGKIKPETKAAFESWIAEKDSAEGSKKASDLVRKAIASESGEIIEDIKKLDQYLIKKSVWIFGGDGWAYDIGYGGLDHVIASGDDVNLLVLDTEVYSNTGGQSSKSTPVGAVAKFAASGKKIRKKDLGMMAMTYGYVYVAQVAIGANQAQYFKALKEAEAYPGPSLIIAYSPCINHGLRAGMGKTQQEQKLAVEAGYWHLYRYNPMLEEEGKNPFTLDSKEPQWDKFQEFLKGEVRYTSLLKTFPEEAKVLFKSAEENAKWRYNSYKMKSEMKF